MKTTITVTDDDDDAAPVEVLAPAAKNPERASEAAVSAGPAPAAADASISAVGTAIDAEDGGPAPGWLLELIEAGGGSSARSPTRAGAGLAPHPGPASDAGAAPDV